MDVIERLKARRQEIEIEHADVMRALYHEIARHRGFGPFEELSDASKDMLISEATTMCEAWDSDAAVRFSHVVGKSRIVDLVNAQYNVARAIVEIEGRILSAIAAHSPRH